MTLPQHADINVGPKHYEEYGDKLLISSMFATLQGEGPYAGQPATFVRFAGCDRGNKVSCPFCDTDFRYGKGVAYSPLQILDWLINDRAHSRMGRDHFGVIDPPMPRLVVITGGEPMLQDNIVPLIVLLNKYDFRVQIESNGDRLPKGWVGELDRIAKCTDNLCLIVSPKVVPSTMKYREPPEAVLPYIDVLKFVIDADPASPYHDVPEWADKLDVPIYVSPLAVYQREVLEGEVANGWDMTLLDHTRTRLNYQHAARLAMNHNYVVSVQQHLWLGLA